MMFRCLEAHGHQTAAERDDCDGHHHDAMSLVKMSRVGFAGPAKIRRTYRPARSEMRGTLRVFVFSEEQIVPWELDEVEA
jgi:hypothetical protein